MSGAAVCTLCLRRPGTINLPQASICRLCTTRAAKLVFEERYADEIWSMTSPKHAFDARSAEDPQTHKDLALAYRDMGLAKEAIAEAATAIVLGLQPAEVDGAAILLLEDLDSAAIKRLGEALNSS